MIHSTPAMMIHHKYLARRLIFTVITTALLLRRTSNGVEGFHPPYNQRALRPLSSKRSRVIKTTFPLSRIIPASWEAEKREQNAETGKDFASSEPNAEKGEDASIVKPKPLDRALHEAKHRTKEKFYYVAAGQVTEKFHKIAQNGSIRKRLYSKLKQVWQEGTIIKRLFARIRRLSGRISTRIQRESSLIRMWSKSAVAGRASTHVLEESIGHATKASASKQGSKLIEKAVANHSRKHQSRRTGNLVAKYVESSGERITVRVARGSSKRLSIRFAKGLTIALPVIGGIFAVTLLQQDFRRLKDEQALHGGTGSSVLFFAGATAADFLDVFLHFFLAYGLLSHVNHHLLAVAEEWSIGCAVVSTACAVFGEVSSFRIHDKTSLQI
jgi:hypothetical protein